ncbi:hypothetical protein AVEN_147821-1 [Araneus ventricosus]|uniref:DDE Tnp4 domain-containing protein n=1 Tax=Araneus ventricosus TaxID=182803 RepID=A0A4Y2CSH3_ARAVE|nr:hypothetical protein AVEN_147821-1 [Araneus ventricosus]
MKDEKVNPDINYPIMRQPIMSHLFPTFCSFGRQNLFHKNASPFQVFVIPALEQERYGEFLPWGAQGWECSPWRDFPAQRKIPGSLSSPFPDDPTSINHSNQTSHYMKIHEGEKMPSEDTFQYLIQAIISGTRAASLIESFPPTVQNCPKVIELLKERFSREDLLVQVYVRELLKMEILKPKLYGDEYINRKGKPTLNVQATCDAKEMFTSVDVSWPGSVHDSRIWTNSQLCLQLRNKGNSVLIGDCGYGIEPCLMTPFEPPTSGAEYSLCTTLIRYCCNRTKSWSSFLDSALVSSVSYTSLSLISFFGGNKFCGGLTSVTPGELALKMLNSLFSVQLVHSVFAE